MLFFRDYDSERLFMFLQIGEQNREKENRKSRLLIGGWKPLFGRFQILFNVGESALFSFSTFYPWRVWTKWPELLFGPQITAQPGSVLLFCSCKVTVTWEFSAALTVCLSPAGVFAPTLFSKAYGNLVCDACTNSTGNSTSNSSGPFVCHNCHYDLVGVEIQLQHHHNDCKKNIPSCLITYYIYFFFLPTAKFYTVP